MTDLGLTETPPDSLIQRYRLTLGALKSLLAMQRGEGGPDGDWNWCFYCADRAIALEEKSPLPDEESVASAVLGWEGSDGYVSLCCTCGNTTELSMCGTDTPVECGSCHRFWKFTLKVACQPAEE